MLPAPCLFPFALTFALWHCAGAHWHPLLDSSLINSSDATSELPSTTVSGSLIKWVIVIVPAILLTLIGLLICVYCRTNPKGDGNEEHRKATQMKSKPVTLQCPLSKTLSKFQPMATENQNRSSGQLFRSNLEKPSVPDMTRQTTVTRLSFGKVDGKTVRSPYTKKVKSKEFDSHAQKVSTSKCTTSSKVVSNISNVIPSMTHKRSVSSKKFKKSFNR